jgi:hypothetical protein
VNQQQMSTRKLLRTMIEQFQRCWIQHTISLHLITQSSSQQGWATSEPGSNLESTLAAPLSLGKRSWRFNIRDAVFGAHFGFLPTWLQRNPQWNYVMAPVSRQQAYLWSIIDHHICMCSISGNSSSIWQCMSNCINSHIRFATNQNSMCMCHSLMHFAIGSWFFFPPVLLMRNCSRDFSSLESLFLDFVQTKLMLGTCNCCFLLDFHRYIYMKMHVLMFFISSRFLSESFCRVISLLNSLLFTSQFL